MKTVAVIEFGTKGHHPAYLSLYARVFFESGYNVIACSPDPTQIRVPLPPNQGGGEFAVAKFELPARLMQKNSISCILGRWQAIASFVKSLRAPGGAPVDFVFICYLDILFLTFPASLLVRGILGVPFSGVIVQPERILSAVSLFPKGTLLGLLNPFSAFKGAGCAGVGVLNETVSQALTRRFALSNVQVLPDVAEVHPANPDNELVTSLRQESKGRRLVGLLGMIKAYKGVFTLIEASQRLRDEPFHFAFVGEIQESALSQIEYRRIQEFRNSRPSNCTFVSEYVPDDSVYDGLFSACDIIFASFVDFPFSSNTLAKAALFGKPVIVSSGYVMESRVRTFRMGKVIAQASVDQCVDAIRGIGAEYLRITSEADFDGYRRAHSVGRLKELLPRLVPL